MAGVPRKARQPPKHPALKKLGIRVRRLREERGLSQEALADAAQFGRSYMSGVERGVRNPSALQLLKLARALRVRVGDLFHQ
jgi:transcriptional regulator with XRE-family HTH domain